MNLVKFGMPKNEFGNIRHAKEFEINLKRFNISISNCHNE